MLVYNKRTVPSLHFRRFQKRGRAVPSAVAFGAALSVGAVRAGVRRAQGISDGSENRPLIQENRPLIQEPSL